MAIRAMVRVTISSRATRRGIRPRGTLLPSPRSGSSNLILSQAEGPNTIDAFHLPRPNEFIPKRLDVEMREVSQVCFNSFKAFSPRVNLTRLPLAPAASPPDI